MSRRALAFGALFSAVLWVWVFLIAFVIVRATA